MANLKPWYQVVTPREDLRDNRPLDASEFAVHLDHIRTKRGTVSQDYLNPARFFDRTYLTRSLIELSSQVVRRLSGIQVETSAVFNMATQFGGGKTHALAALFHLARAGEEAKKWKGIDSILERAEVKTVPKADVAVFVGTEFDALSGRSGDGEPTRLTPWGEIAWQLGGEQLFATVAEHDKKKVAPAGDVLRKMLPAGPTLILMDELLNYVSGARKVEMRDQFFAFLQNLCEEARARNNMALCVSVPMSELEMSPEDQRDYDSIKKLCDRTGKAIMMSADEEMAEIIRRRLFEWHGLPEDGRKTVAAYAEWAIEHAQELTGFDAENAQQKFASSYPFHPNVLSVFERKWQALQRFQRTRGVLRLLALWVAHAYQEEHRQSTKEPLITLGTAPLDNLNFRSAMFEQLGESKLEVPVTTDILGRADAHALRLDKEADPEIKKQQLHRKVATVIFFESNGGQSQSRAEATLPEIRAGIGGPDVNLVNTDTVLESLASSCFYLNWERNRYRFGLSPNLNQVLVARQGSVKEKEITDRVNQEIQTIFDKDKKDTDAYKEVDRKYFPSRSNDVPSRPVLSLVVMGPEHQNDQAKTLELAKSIVQSCGTSGRTFKSALIFSVPDSMDQVFAAGRELLAWEDIDEDHETKNRFDEAQKGQLKRNLGNAKRNFSETVFRAYRHVYLLDKSNELKHVDLGQITSSSGNSIVELIFRELERTDFVTTGVSASKVVRNWPGALNGWATQAVRDAFFSSPQLPRLLKVDAIRRTISDGVTNGEIGYATKGADGRFKLQKLKETLFEKDVEISEDVFILQEAEAQKLKVPPRLASLVLNKPDAMLAPGEKVSFSCSGRDQYGQTSPVSSVSWIANGGKIDEQGLFTAGQEPGQYSVRAEASGLEVIAEVRIRLPGATTGGGGPNGPGPGKSLVKWEGDVPPQKWMNFYTKVLTRFASNPDLKLRVTFQASVEADQLDSKTSETRAGLKELGLSDDILSV